MSRERIVRIAILTALTALPVVALAAAAVGSDATGGGCFMSWCAGLLSGSPCGG